MQLTFLGAGAHTTKGEYNSNMLIEENGKRLLIDCGFTCAQALGEIGLSHRDIDAVYVSHLHFDHVAGLEWLGFYTRFDPGYLGKPTLFAADPLVGPLWNNVLRGSMETVTGHPALTLDDYFDVNRVQIEHFPTTVGAPVQFETFTWQPIHTMHVGRFKWQEITFHIMPFEHILGEDATVYSYGLVITKPKMGETILITTDTRLDHSNHHLYKTADVIYHDCETIPHMMSGVHPHYEQLKLFPENIRNKMWLYHRNNDLYLDMAVFDGFKGFVRKGETHIFGTLEETTEG